MNRKALCKLLAVPVCVLLILLLCAAPAVADGVDLEQDYFGDNDPVAPHDDIVFSEWTSTTSLPTTAGSYKLMNDVVIASTWYPQTGETNLDLNGHTVRFTGEYGVTIFVLQDRRLNLYDSVGNGVIISGKVKRISDTIRYLGIGVQVQGAFTQYGGTILGNPDGQSKGVSVISGGEFTLVNGTIKNHINIVESGVDMYGCGVNVNKGTFVQNGGLITGNTGNSGVGVDVHDGTFIMRGGAITNNTASYEGGGVRVWNSSFIMHNGIIADNTAKTGNGGGVELLFDGTGKLLGGIITNNTARQGGGISILSTSMLTMLDCNITNNKATYYGGICVIGSFTLFNGNITGNTAEYYGGGVGEHGNFTMCGGKIADNKGLYGSGGVTVGNNFTMNGGTIANNIAGRFGGGGVGISGGGGNFTMNGGIITGNKATERPNNGGGVLVDLSSIDADTNFILSGGIIDGNFAIESYNSQKYVPNNVLVDDPLLKYDLRVTIADVGLKEGTKVGISTSLLPNLETPVAFTDSSNADYSRYFFADNAIYSIKNIDNVLYLAYNTVIEPVINTTDTVNAATVAEVGYETTPTRINDLTVPILTRNGKSVPLNDSVVVKKMVRGVETEVTASVNPDGTLNIAPEEIADADSLSVTFVGRKIGDVSGDGNPDTLDAAMILKSSAEIEALDVKGDFYGDVTNDGQTTTLDAARILQHSADMTDDDYELIE